MNLYLLAEGTDYTIPSILMGGMTVMGTVVLTLWLKIDAERVKCDAALEEERDECVKRMDTLSERFSNEISVLQGEVRQLYKEFTNHKNGQ